MGTACCGSKVVKNFRVVDISRVPQGILPTAYFKSQETEEKWNKALEKYNNSEQPLQEFKLQNLSGFKTLVFEGTPREMKFLIWYKVLNITDEDVSLKDLFNSNVSDCLIDIEKDINRTFPSHTYFANENGQNDLKDTLLAIANYKPHLGYCQGMNYIAATLLITFDGDKDKTFSILSCLFTNFGAGRLFESGFPLVKELSAKFHQDLKLFKPNIEAHIVKHNFDDALWLTKWMITMFTYSFQYEYVIRFWDGIFSKGIQYMVNIALAIVDQLEEEMLKKDLASLCDFFSNIGKRNLNIDHIMKSSLKYESQDQNNNRNDMI